MGPHKAIAMALLCGCDLRPMGVNGINSDNVIQMLASYTENEVLAHICQWRKAEHYKEWNARITDINICGDCGHVGRSSRHKENGCGVCNTQKGCIASFWKYID